MTITIAHENIPHESKSGSICVDLSPKKKEEYEENSVFIMLCSGLDVK
jgi:hypothetical protein